ncbi:BatD family protein [Terrimonas pollutisoli]|uniref:BatD family protein n=1 Tax=Terrimonas pollutisoli TaxID=3034147 RepID=UPI0023EAE328|nr:BatD family protein [Terrimonas sp. H1YJ31]
MKKFFSHTTIFLLLMQPYICTQAQLVFKTIVTQGPIVAGEPFQVQYVLENLDKEDEFFPPDFKGFRSVSGPNVYVGSAYGIDGASKLKNIVYTLVAAKPGKFIIPGAAARVGDNYIKSQNAEIEILSKAAAGSRGSQQELMEPNEDYFLAPGEDPYEKMRHNLFMKVAVDKKACYVGEPVTAIFKLYSRLESKSDIVKNPGFYGFTVQDMISLNNKMMMTEVVGGKKFDVHVVRKVQLYPLQAGQFTIDPMEVQNKVEFSKSAVHKKTEQEIVEGVFPEARSIEKENTVVYENNMRTEAIAIAVKATPSKNKPAEFNGATGKFSIDAFVEKSELAKNEEADLVIIISGKGNFTQLSPPAVQWPAGIEGLEPIIKDYLSHETSPMTGRREFHFRFVSAKPGRYELPAINFSFFNPDSNDYKKLITKPISISITGKEKKFVAEKNNGFATPGNGAYKKWSLLALLIALGTLLFFWIRKRKKIKPVPELQETKSAPNIQWLQPAVILSEADDKTFYTNLRNGVWTFLSEQFNLRGSKANKANLLQAMNGAGIEGKEQKEILDILEQCETGIFINADTIGMDKMKLLERAKLSIEKISQRTRQ